MAGIVMFGWAMSIATNKRRAGAEGEALRTQLAVLRTASNECVAELAHEQAAFQEHNERVDSLRARVDEFEALDDRGVPGNRYESYLETFDAYNRSVQEWRARADSLESRRIACEDLVQRHNALADSLRRRYEVRPEAIP